MNESVTQTAKIVTVGDQKGGVAKTTTAVNEAHLLATQGHRVLLVDFDPQGQSGSSLGIDPAPGIFDFFVGERPLTNCLWETGRDNLTLIPSNQKTKVAAMTLSMQISQGDTTRGQLIEYLRAAGREFDFVILDTPPSGIFQELALEAADTIVIPATCDYLSMEGVRNTLATIEKLGNRWAKTIILPTIYDARSREARYNLGLLRQTYGGRVAEPIPASAAVREAVAAGQTIWEYSNLKSDTLPLVRRAYTALADRLIGGAP